ncbi:MAG: hypothetical protein LBG90_06615 [Spirochaetaceae bacterium]|jgi:hypothetical protein|nr:hypothetical protein [Spirochaetaceae bacterium]
MAKRFLSMAGLSVAVLTFVLVLAGCPKPEEEEKPTFPDNLVGTWTNSDYTISFANDGGGKITRDDLDQPCDLESVSENTYTCDGGGYSFSFTATVDSDTLTIAESRDNRVPNGTYTKQQ